MYFNNFTTVLAQTGTESPAHINSIFDFMVKGGPIMIPIGLCSLIAFTVVIERLLSLRRRAVLPPELLPGLRPLLASNTNLQQALDFCKAHASAAANVLSVAIKRLGEPEEQLEKHIQEAGEREAIVLRKRLRVLSVIGSVAPLLGLLGTITGMITAFQTVAASGEALGRTELLAKGIYEAMITTAGGLVVAIPVLVCYHWLSAKVDARVVQIDRLAIDFIEEFAEPGRAPIKPTANGHAAERPSRHPILETVSQS